MKLIEKITYITFGINIVAVLFYFVALPIIVMTVPYTFDMIAANKGHNPYNYIMTIVAMIAAFHWIYCIWFLFKYDKYSKSIFPLFLFNVLYSPIYFYRVRIKKRPLRNKINKLKEDIVKEDKSISDDEFIDLTRNNIFGLINLWISKESQLDYKKNVPIAHVSNELFCQWEDSYFPNLDGFRQAFNKEELEILSEFDKAMNDMIGKFSQDLPVIEVFIETEEWKELNKKVIEIKEKLNTVGNIK